MNFAIGLDIGAEGAAVLLNGNAAVFVLHWKKVVRGGEKRFLLTIAEAGKPKAEIIDHLIGGWGLGEALFSVLASYCMSMGGRALVAAEDMYMGVNPLTTIEIAKFGGAIVSRLEPFDPMKAARWVRPPTWRKSILGLKQTTKRDDAKAASMAQIPGLVVGLDELLEKLKPAAKEHVCDAAGVALWAIRELNYK